MLLAVFNLRDSEFRTRYNHCSKWINRAKLKSQWSRTLYLQNVYKADARTLSYMYRIRTVLWDINTSL